MPDDGKMYGWGDTVNIPYIRATLGKPEPAFEEPATEDLGTRHPYESKIKSSSLTAC
jgi:hypothetical protein